MSEDSKTVKQKLFERHGLEVKGESGDNRYADCPFCGKSDKFYFNVETGLWDCKVCSESGNVYTFLKKIYQLHLKETRRVDYQRLSKARSIPVEGLKAWGLAWNGEHWLIPCFNEQDKLLDVRTWRPPRGQGKSRTMASPGCKTQLVNARALALSDRSARVWLCEGEWDGIILDWLLRALNMPDVAVATPGANVFKDDWLPLFRGRDVVLCFDNDEAGLKGFERANRMLSGVASSVLYIKWLEGDPEGFDIRDLVSTGLKASEEPEKILQTLVARLDTAPQTAESSRPAPIVSPEFVVYEVGGLSGSEIPSWEEVLEGYRKNISMSEEMETALKICFATAFTNQLPGDPLWIYLVGPAGCGKTLLLMSLAGSDRCVYQSSLTPHALVSGFRSEQDPSILPTWNNRCAILKDFTELLASHPQAKEEIYSVLRGAYDGYVRRSFGNGVVREYYLRFSMICGVTPAIHGDRQAMLGERFLKYELFRGSDWSADSEIRAAIGSIGREANIELELMELAGKFLARPLTPEDLPRVPNWVVERMVGLCQLIAALRANVEREPGADARLKYRPQREVGTRLAKQLVKLGQALAFVSGKNAIDGEEYSIMERVARDTATGFHLEIIEALIDSGGEAVRKEIADITGLPDTTLGRALDDLAALSVIHKIKPDAGQTRTGMVGRPAILWRVSGWVQRLWERSQFGKGVVEELKPVRRPRRRLKATVRRRANYERNN